MKILIFLAALFFVFDWFGLDEAALFVCLATMAASAALFAEAQRQGV